MLRFIAPALAPGRNRSPCPRVMLYFFRLMWGGLFAVLTACGGGGDTYTPATGTAASPIPAVITLSDSSERVLASNVLAQGDVYLVKAQLVPNTSGVTIANQLVTFRTDASYAGFFPAPTFVSSSATATVTTTQTAVLSAITDATGVARAYLLAKAQNGSTITASCSPLACSATPLAFQTYPLNSPPDTALSGQPYASNFSIDATTVTIEGFAIDGVSATLSAQLSDRYGNAVQAGTRVYWKAAYGQIDTFCDLDATSSCKVTYLSGGVRPANGIVKIMAYVEGPEPFTDVNGNRRYDVGEPYVDVGALFLDRNQNGIYDTGVDERIAGGQGGALTCAATAMTLANTCDGVWTSKVRLAQSMNLILTTPQALVTLDGERTVSGFALKVTDLNGNLMATGTTVTATLVEQSLPEGTVACRIGSVVFNGGTSYAVLLNGAASCASATVLVTVKAVSGLTSAQVFAGVAALPAAIQLQGERALSGFSIRVTDTAGAAMVGGATVTATALEQLVPADGVVCRAISVVQDDSVSYRVLLNGAPLCATALVLVTVRSAAGPTSSAVF